MFSFFCSVLLISFLIPPNSASSPSICTEISTNFYYELIDYATYTASATLKPVTKGANQYISVSNLKTFGTLSNNSADSICASLYTNDDNTYPCFKNYSNPFEFGIENSTIFSLYANFPSYSWDIYDGIIDGGNLIFSNGGLFFDQSSPCFTEYSTIPFTSISNRTDCCKKFSPAPSTSGGLKCKEFNSRTSVLNSTDNYLIFATTSMNYTLEDGEIIVNGSFQGPSNFSVVYSINFDPFCDSQRNVSFNCNYTLPEIDNEVLINLEIYPQQGLAHHIPIAGRIIFRGGQALMEEGVPFTPQNNCLYFNSYYSSNQISQSQFCCKVFE